MQNHVGNDYLHVRIASPQPVNCALRHTHYFERHRPLLRAFSSLRLSLLRLSPQAFSRESMWGRHAPSQVPPGWRLRANFFQ